MCLFAILEAFLEKKLSLSLATFFTCALSEWVERTAPLLQGGTSPHCQRPAGPWRQDRRGHQEGEHRPPHCQPRWAGGGKKAII